MFSPVEVGFRCASGVSVAISKDVTLSAFKITNSSDDFVLEDCVGIVVDSGSNKLQLSFVAVVPPSCTKQ